MEAQTCSHTLQACSFDSYTPSHTCYTSHTPSHTCSHPCYTSHTSEGSSKCVCNCSEAANDSCRVFDNSVGCQCCSGGNPDWKSSSYTNNNTLEDSYNCCKTSKDSSQVLKDSYSYPYASKDLTSCSTEFRDSQKSSYNYNSASYNCGDDCNYARGSQGVAAPPEDPFMSAVLAFCSKMSGQLDTLDNCSIYDEFRNYTSDARKVAVA